MMTRDETNHVLFILEKIAEGCTEVIKDKDVIENEKIIAKLILDDLKIPIKILHTGLHRGFIKQESKKI